MDKINQMLRRPCNVAYEIPLCVESYSEVIVAWNRYCSGGALPIPSSARSIIRSIFDFHANSSDHIILYYSRNQDKFLLMCRVGGRLVNLWAPAVDIQHRDKCFVATYS